MLKKLTAIQCELKAPKNQNNSYGGYKYRSCEDILEAVKPLLNKYNASVTLSDSIEVLGDRVYLKVTATFFDNESDKSISVSAYAREPLTQKGMSDSQITGTASSYARKYALNGLFLIDDTKDADTDEFRNQQKSKEERAFDKKVEKDNKTTISAKDQAILKNMVEAKGYKVEEIFPKGLEITGEQYTQALETLKTLKAKGA